MFSELFRKYKIENTPLFAKMIRCVAYFLSEWIRALSVQERSHGLADSPLYVPKWRFKVAKLNRV
jgi:hypothetical protein